MIQLMLAVMIIILMDNSKTLAASNFATIDNTIVNYLTVTAGAAGTTLVEAQVIPASRSEVPIEVTV